MATNSQIAFNPQGETVLFIADAPSPLGVQAPVSDKFSANETGQVRIVNGGTVAVYMGVGNTAAEAQTNADTALSLTANGDTASVVVLLPGAIEIMRFPYGSYFSGTSTAASNVYITPGQGL